MARAASAFTSALPSAWHDSTQAELAQRWRHACKRNADWYAQVPPALRRLDPPARKAQAQLLPQHPRAAATCCRPPWAWAMALQVTPDVHSDDASSLPWIVFLLGGQGSKGVHLSLPSARHDNTQAELTQRWRHACKRNADWCAQAPPALPRRAKKTQGQAQPLPQHPRAAVTCCEAPAVSTPPPALFMFWHCKCSCVLLGITHPGGADALQLMMISLHGSSCLRMHACVRCTSCAACVQAWQPSHPLPGVPACGASGSDATPNQGCSQATNGAAIAAPTACLKTSRTGECMTWHICS